MHITTISKDFIELEIHPTYKLKLGQVAQLITHNNKMMLRPSDGKVPIGIVETIYEEYSVDVLNRYATINCSRRIHNTIEFDPECFYVANASLYVNARGQVTTVKNFHECPVVGMVIEPPTAADPVLKMIWL